MNNTPKQDQIDSIRFRIDCARETDNVRLSIIGKDQWILVSKADALAMDINTIGAVLGYEPRMEAR